MLRIVVRLEAAIRFFFVIKKIAIKIGALDKKIVWQNHYYHYFCYLKLIAQINRGKKI